MKYLMEAVSITAPAGLKPLQLARQAKQPLRQTRPSNQHRGPASGPAGGYSTPGQLPGRGGAAGFLCVSCNTNSSFGLWQ